MVQCTESLFAVLYKFTLFSYRSLLMIIIYIGKPRRHRVRGCLCFDSLRLTRQRCNSPPQVPMLNVLLLTSVQLRKITH